MKWFRWPKRKTEKEEVHGGYAREAYLLASAMRGPDYPDSNTLKWIFTARLRHWCGAPTGHGLSVRSGPVVIQKFADCRRAIRLFPLMHEPSDRTLAMQHYLQHVRWALQSIQFMDDEDAALEASALDDLACALMNAGREERRDALEALFRIWMERGRR